MSPLGQNMTTGIEVEEIENEKKKEKRKLFFQVSSESLILSRFYSISLLALVLVYH